MLFDFAVICINYKTASMTIKCIQSVLPEIAHHHACAVIVDNFSDDGSVETISQWISSEGLSEKVKLVASPINSGFSGGNNAGITSVPAKYYILLNSDTLVRPGAFETILNTFSINEKIGLVSPRLEDEDGTGQISCFRFHSPISEFINTANTGYITKLLENYNVPIPLADQITYPHWTSFACIAIKQDVLEDIGLMSEGYFLYFEDTDYCRKAREAGWLTVNNPTARVVHFRGGSAELKQKVQMKKRLPRYYFESRKLYFSTFYGRTGFVFTNIFWLLGRCISKSRELLENKPRKTSALEWLDIWTAGKVFPTTGRK